MFSRKNKKIFFFATKKENLEEVRDEKKKEKRKLQNLRKEEKNPQENKSYENLISIESKRCCTTRQ